jgi:hypothetical protein
MQFPEQSDRPLYVCCHCGEYLGRTSRLWCDYCSTSAKRKEMDEENEKFFASQGLTYLCRGLHKNEKTQEKHIEKEG